MAQNKKRAGKSNVGNDVVLPKALPTKPKSATPATGVDRGQSLRRDTKDTIVNSVSDVRSAPDVISAIRQLSEDEGVTSTSIYTAATLANTPFKLTAYTTNTQEFDGAATRVVGGIVASMDTLSDYTKKFDDKPTIRQFIEMALLDSLKTSGLGCELVLDENKLPSRLQLVSYEQLEWVSNGKGGRFPKQVVRGSDDIDLNIPNFWVAEINKDPTKAYSVPLLRAALNVSVTNHEFIEDMRRVVQKSGHSRLVVTLNSEKIMAMADEDTLEDPNKLMAFMQTHQTNVTNAIAGLSPEDSIVVFDNTEVNVEDIGGNKSDYVPLMQTLNNMQATALKTPSSVIGLRSEGSQSLSNMEALVYLKMMTALRGPIIDVLSRAFTLAARLYGLDVYVKADFEAINLRPEDELEAYRTMKQTRQLQLLSLGVWSDEQYCHESGNPWRADMPPLSGTGFMSGSSVGAGKEDTDDTGGAERTMSSDTPKKGGGESQ